VIYSEVFKAKMIERLIGPPAITALALQREVGVAQTTLSKWLREARGATTLSDMAKKRRRSSGEGPSPKKWSALEKFQIVLEASSVPEAELGEFLRRRGLHEIDLKLWRDVASKAAMDALEGGAKAARESAADQRRIKELEQELARKEKRLRSADALLDLQKKVQAIWGDTDDSTPPRSDG